jgi:hypothetical protein
MCVNYRGKHAVILLLLLVITVRRIKPCEPNHMGAHLHSTGIIGLFAAMGSLAKWTGGNQADRNRWKKVVCRRTGKRPSVFELFSVVLQDSNYHIIRGYIQNILDWCRHLYSSCGSAKHRYMVGLPCLVSQCAKLHVAGWTWAVFTSVYLESCISLSPQSGNFWIHPRMDWVRPRSVDLSFWMNLILLGKVIARLF